MKLRSMGHRTPTRSIENKNLIKLRTPEKNASGAAARAFRTSAKSHAKSATAMPAYGKEFETRTPNKTLPMAIAQERLRRIGEIMPELTRPEQSLLKYFADQFEPGCNQKPEGVVMSFALVLVDVECGIEPFSGQPIQGIFIGLPPIFYRGLDMKFETVVENIFPEWFADEIKICRNK